MAHLQYRGPHFGNRCAKPLVQQKLWMETNLVMWVMQQRIIEMLKTDMNPMHNICFETTFE